MITTIIIMSIIYVGSYIFYYLCGECGEDDEPFVDLYLHGFLAIVFLIEKFRSNGTLISVPFHWLAFLFILLSSHSIRYFIFKITTEGKSISNYSPTATSANIVRINECIKSKTDTSNESNTYTTDDFIDSVRDSVVTESNRLEITNSHLDDNKDKKKSSNRWKNLEF